MTQNCGTCAAALVAVPPYVENSVLKQQQVTRDLSSAQGSYKILLIGVFAALWADSRDRLPSEWRKQIQSHKLNLGSLRKREISKTSLKTDQSDLSKEGFSGMRDSFADTKLLTVDKCLPVKPEVMTPISFDTLLRSEEVSGGRVTKNKAGVGEH